MELLERFQKYAEDFEQTYIDDDWSRIAPHFAEDAVYQVHGLPVFPIDAQGRDAVLAALKGAIDGFDRLCASRSLKLTAPPAVAGRTVTIYWTGTYSLDGAPDLDFAGTEEAHYNESGEIVRLIDSYSDEVARAVGHWLEEHREKLGAN